MELRDKRPEKIDQGMVALFRVSSWIDVLEGKVSIVDRRVLSGRCWSEDWGEKCMTIEVSISGSFEKLRVLSI
jgi:hypothetical protein